MLRVLVPGDGGAPEHRWQRRGSPTLAVRYGAVEKLIYSAEYQRLCTVLRELRQEAGLTQVQLAAELGVPQSFVSKYEFGERRLDVIELGHVAKALGVTVMGVLERVEGWDGPDTPIAKLMRIGRITNLPVHPAPVAAAQGRLVHTARWLAA